MIDVTSASPRKLSKSAAKRTSCRYLHEIELLTIDSIIVKNYVRLLNYTWFPLRVAQRGAGRTHTRETGEQDETRAKKARGREGDR